MIFINILNETAITVFKHIQWSSHNQCTFRNNDFEPEMVSSQ